MRSNSRPHRRRRLTRNVLAVLAGLAVAYRLLRNADSFHDTWTFAVAVLLVGLAVAAGTRRHVTATSSRDDDQEPLTDRELLRRVDPGSADAALRITQALAHRPRRY